MVQKMIHKMQYVDSLSDWILPGSPIMVWTHLNLSEGMKVRKEVKRMRTLLKLMVSLLHTFCLILL
jgi:hypothetical protein